MSTGCLTRQQQQQQQRASAQHVGVGSGPPSSIQQATSNKQAGQQASASASGNCQCTRHLFPDASNTHSPWSRYGMLPKVLCMYLHVDTNINRGTCMLSPPTARLSIMMAVPALPRSRSIFRGTTSYVLEFAPRLSATNTSILLTACVLCAPLRDFLLL